MTTRQKRELQRDFFRKAGPNIEVFRRMSDLIPDTKFFIIDDKDRIITFNRQNPENGNFRDEMEVVGRTLADVAAETGFYDEAHFVRTFRKSRGLTPGAYRRTHRQQ